MSVAVTQRIEVQLSVGVWTDISADVVASEGVRWRRGINGRGPMDRMASAGTLSFTLRNDAHNSGGLIGYYSPDHVNCRAGFAMGIPVRTVYRYSSTDYVRWRGKLATIDPIPGLLKERRVHVAAVGTIGDLFAEKIRAIPPQLDQTEVQLLTAVLAAVPTEAQPPATSFDAAIDAYPFAFDDLESGTLAATAIDKVIQSSGGVYVERGDGTHQYINRFTRASTLTSFTFTDPQLIGLVRPTSLDATFNHFRVGTHAKDVGAVATDVLASYDGRLAIPAGESLNDLFLDYRDPLSNDYMGGTDFVDPLVSGTDYVWNAAEDGSGADVTADVTTVATFFASTVKIDITNTGSVPAYKQVLQGRGRSIRDRSPVWSDASVTMNYGVRAHPDLDLPYQDDPIVGRDLATDYAAQYANQANQIDHQEFVANASNALMLQALTSEISDVKTVTESVTGTTDVDGYIQWIEFDVREARGGPLIICRFGLAPKIEHAFAFAEDLTVADLLVMSSPSPETRIDVALIGLSEIAA